MEEGDGWCGIYRELKPVWLITVKAIYAGLSNTARVEEVKDAEDAGSGGRIERGVIAISSSQRDRQRLPSPHSSPMPK